MLLTLAANSLRRYMKPEKTSDRTPLKLEDLPRFARDQLDLFGLNISTDMLAGADFEKLDRLRDSADKASCPCLVLIESEPQPFCDQDDDRGDAAIERLTRVARAAHRLGCNSCAVAVAGPDNEDSLAFAAERLKQVLHSADRLEVNLLLMSHKGLTAEPDRLTELIKKIGGFRIGTFPDFEAASKTPDPIHFLRRLTPYAAAVTASCFDFGASKGLPVHSAYDLTAYAEAVASVGYTGTLAIDFRGEGDPGAAVRSARTVLEAAIGSEASSE